MNKDILFPKGVIVVAVSKLQPVEKIKFLYDGGHRNFGENYVQEFLEKKQTLPTDICWHFIGSIQSKKLKSIVGNVDLIHSLDSLEHAQKINTLSLEKGIKQKVLVQVNIADESSKSGISEKDLPKFLLSLTALPGLIVQGLMAMPPLTENPEITRPYFKKMKQLFEFYKKDLPDFKVLSMGTSHDYLVAIEEGSNCIRLGTILFGERTK